MLLRVGYFEVMEWTGIEPATPCLQKPNEKVPGFYKLLNLRAVLGIGVEVEGPFGAPHRKKLTTNLTTDEECRRSARLTRAPLSGRAATPIRRSS